VGGGKGPFGAMKFMLTVPEGKPREVEEEVEEVRARLPESASCACLRPMCEFPSEARLLCEWRCIA
jgi:hypothetical protein